MSKLSTIEISGADAATFLQGQLSCDVLALTPNSASYMASCDRKGRMVANGFIYFLPPNYYLILPSSMIPLLLGHFKKYALFSKVSLAEKNDPELIEKTLLTIEPEPISIESILNSGLPLIEPKTSGLFTPQMLNWQKNGGVSFTKGCFLGQEVVARTEHLGQLKRHLHPIKLDCPERHEPGDVLQNELKENLGIFCTTKSAENNYLAVIQDKALNEPLFCSHFVKICYSE